MPLASTLAQERADLKFLQALWWGSLLLALGPLWLVHRDVWDGVIGSYGLERGDYQGIRDWLLPSNWGLVYLIFRAIGWLSDLLTLPHWVWVKLLLCASVIGISLETRRLCSEVLRWNARDSSAAALLTLVFPCWYLLYGSTFVYVVFVWWVFLGHRWIHACSRWRQVAGFALLLASFQVNSNFVMVFALEAARFVCRDRRFPWSWGRSALIAVSAISVYLMLRMLLPPHGTYLGYNNLVLPFTVDGLISWVRSALMFATWLPLMMAPAALAYMAVRHKRSATGSLDRDGVIAVMLLIAGALFAYMAVGKGAPLFVVNLPFKWLGARQHLGQEAGQWVYTTVDGWSTRHVFLFSLPASIAVIGVLRLALRRADGEMQRRPWWMAVVLAVALNLAFMLHGHSAKLARFAQEQSIVNALRASAAPPPGELDLQLTPPPRWSVWTYEANYWMWLAYGRTAWAVAAYPLVDLKGASVLNEPIRDREAAVAAVHLRDNNLMSDFQSGGCRTTWEVRLPEGLGARTWALLRTGSVPAAQLKEISRHCTASPNADS